MGGLGNQMFQYAIGRNLAERNNTNLKLDISWFSQAKEKSVLREYKLNFFNIIENIATEKEIRGFKYYKKINDWKYFLYNLFFANNSIYITEELKDVSKKILEKNYKNIYLDGYWQNEKYFKDTENIIRQEFTLKNKLDIKLDKLIEKIKNSSSISIHIRRGDYVHNKKTNSIHGICSLDYYQKTIKYIDEKIKNPVFFIFSDDIEWSKNNLKTKFPTIFVEGNKDNEDLILMSMCKHNIIANSSFSWWGAWLNNNSNKIVIAPQKWFNDSNKNTENLIPNTWIQI